MSASLARPSFNIVDCLIRVAIFVVIWILIKNFIDWLKEQPQAMLEQVNNAQARQIEYLREQVGQLQEVRQQMSDVLRQRTADSVLKWCWFVLKLAQFIAWVYFSLAAI